MENDCGRVGCAETGSRAGASSQQAVSTEGFDPARVRALATKAAPLLDCWRKSNTPRGGRERLVGFVIDQDAIGLGLSEPLFALDALTELARIAIAMEAAKPSRRETGSTRKGDSAGRNGIAQEDAPSSDMGKGE